MPLRHKVLFLDDAIHEKAFALLAPECETAGRTAAWAADEEILPLCGEADAFLVRACKVTEIGRASCRERVC